jgi:hypothetical protein
VLSVTQFLAEKNKLEGDEFVVLFELEYSAGQFLRYARWDADVTFESHTWSKFPIARIETSQSTQGDIPAFDIGFSNVGREIQSILEFNEVEGLPGRLVIVHSSMLGDPTAKIEEPFIVVSIRADNLSAVMTVAPINFDPFGVMLPRDIVTPDNFPGILGARGRYLV